MASLHAAGTKVAAVSRLMVLRSSRDLCRDRHRRQGVVPAASPGLWRTGRKQQARAGLWP